MRKIVFALAAVAGIVLDQAVKQWARTVLKNTAGGEIAVLQNVFYLRYTENRGAAFGILQGQRWLFLVLTAIVALTVIYILFIKKPQQGWIPGLPMALVLAGAVGNAIDRAVFGYVTDLFEFRLINFAIFNVADTLLVCSVIVIMTWMIYAEYEAWRSKK